MGEHEPTRAEQVAAVARALDALRSAYREAVAAIDAIQDPQQAFTSATDLARVLEGLYQEESPKVRARQAGRIWEAEELSLAGLAQRIGVSKARADQLVRAAKTSKGKAPEGEEEP